MKFALCIVALTFMVSVEAVPQDIFSVGPSRSMASYGSSSSSSSSSRVPAGLTPPIVSPTNEKEYFDNKLESIQGAIKDTIEAGKDLQDMEKALQNIVNLSSLIWLTESATEYATATDKYENLWKPGKQPYRNIYGKNSQII